MDPPAMNTGTPWLEMDLADLKTCLERGDTIEAIAVFLQRTKAEVREKIAELNLPARE